jgi:hypothetical protein
MSNDCQPEKIATYTATHHQTCNVWRRRLLGWGLRVLGQLLINNVKDRKKGYSLLTSMFPPESPLWPEMAPEVENFLYRKPFVAEENVSMIVKKIERCQ